MNKKLSLLAIISLVLALFLTSCAGKAKSNPQMEENDDTERGVIVLSLNPEIEIEYDKDGKVTDVRGSNKDGTKIVEDYNNFIGKDSTVVLRELVEKINDAGYFIEEVGGTGKVLTLELKEGSFLPDEDFIVRIGKAVEEKVSDLDIEVKLDSDSKKDDKNDKDKNKTDDDKIDDKNSITVPVAPTKDNTDYDDTDYAPTAAPTVDDTDYDDTDYAPTAAPTKAPVVNDSDYDDSDYDDSDYDNSDYDD